MLTGIREKAHYAWLFPVFAGILLMQSCAVDPNHVHCVVVPEESDYTGEWLKNHDAVRDGVIDTAECKRLDAEIDNSDGNKNGKVRWASCLSGPDCDEAGAF